MFFLIGEEEQSCIRQLHKYKQCQRVESSQIISDFAKGIPDQCPQPTALQFSNSKNL